MSLHSSEKKKKKIASEEIADILCIFDASALGYHW